MRKILFAFTMIALFSAASSLFVISGGSELKLVREWITERKTGETITRLNTAPILLYHDIGDRGLYSIPYDTLREHFELFRKKNIRVISLEELARSIETGSSFEEKVIVITFDDGYRSHHRKLIPLVREFGYPVTLFLYTDVINRGILSWNQVREIQEAGIDVQAHSVSHADLTSFDIKENPRRIFEELYISKKLIELHLQKPVDFFAYPYGRYNLQTVEYARLAGYRRTFTTDYGPNIVTRDNFNIRRHHIKSSFDLDYIENLIK